MFLGLSSDIYNYFQGRESVRKVDVRKYPQISGANRAAQSLYIVWGVLRTRRERIPPMHSLSYLSAKGDASPNSARVSPLYYAKASG